MYRVASVWAMTAGFRTGSGVSAYVVQGDSRGAVASNSPGSMPIVLWSTEHVLPCLPILVLLLMGRLLLVQVAVSVQVPLPVYVPLLVEVALWVTTVSRRRHTQLVMVLRLDSEPLSRLRLRAELGLVTQLRGL